MGIRKILRTKKSYEELANDVEASKRTLVDSELAAGKTMRGSYVSAVFEVVQVFMELSAQHIYALNDVANSLKGAEEALQNIEVHLRSR